MRSPRTVTFGETMAMLHSTTVGSLAHLPSMEIGIGGAESNVAIGLSRLGIASAWVTRIGDDELGGRVLREIRAENVDVIAVTDPARPTGLMIKSHPTTDATTVTYYRAGSAASALGPDDIPEGMIEGAELLHLTGITPLLSSSARRTVLHAIQRARTAGTLVSFDVNHRTALASRADAAPILADIATQSDIVFGGETELALIAEGLGNAPDASTSRRAEDLLAILAAAGIPESVCKRGEHGALALIAGELDSSPAHRVHVLDTVGAGDAFVAGYLSARLDGLDIQARLQRANACGAYACMSPGDWEGAPRPRDIEPLSEQEADPVRR